MRSVILAAVMLCVLLTYPFAQSTQNQSKEEPNKAAAQSKKAPEQTAKPAEPMLPAPEEPRPSKKASTDKGKDKEEHYDMTEVPPVVTHHQVTVDSKVSEIEVDLANRARLF